MTPVNLPSFVPDSLIQRAISLEQLGVNEYAWDKIDALLLLNLCREHKEVILGGDVLGLFKLDGHIEYTYDNWYIIDERATNVSESSIALAEEKVQFYSRILKDQEQIFTLLFAFVFANRAD